MQTLMPDAPIETIIPNELTFGFGSPSGLSEEVNQYFIYVHPITGSYVVYREKKKRILAVFRCEPHGRRNEQRSATLQKSIGHEVTREEMLTIAQNHFNGRWRISD